MAGFEVRDSDGEDDFNVRLDLSKRDNALQQTKKPILATHELNEAAKAGLSRALTTTGHSPNQPVVVVPARKRPKSFNERTSRRTSNLVTTEDGGSNGHIPPSEVFDNLVPPRQDVLETDPWQVGADSAETLHEQVNDNEAMSNPSEHVSAGSKALVDEHQDGPSLEQDELSMACETRVQPRQHSASGKKRKAEATAVESDELDLGIPPEMYKPRSSRSRANPLDNQSSFAESISKPTESGGLKKIKRRKTDGALLKRRRHDSDDESDAIEIEKPKRGRPKKTKSEAARRNDEAAAVEPSDDIWDVGYSNTAATSAVADGAETDAIASKANDATNVQAPNQEETTHEAEGRKKKPRGRPKKSVVIDLVEDDDSDEAEVDVQERVNPEPGLVLQDISNLQRQTSEKPSFEPAELEGLTTDEKENKITMPETPKSRTKGPDKHSPLQSSKLQYRVGLSKTHRIEPLLRIKRK